MSTFGAFWALSFTVRMHVLHIKSSALDLKSAAKFTNWGFWAPVILKRQTIRETPWWKTCFVSSLPSDVMRFAYSVTGIGRWRPNILSHWTDWRLGWPTTDIGVPYFGYPSADKGGLGSAPVYGYEPLASDSRTTASSQYASSEWCRSRRDKDDHCKTTNKQELEQIDGLPKCRSRSKVSTWSWKGSLFDV